MKRQCLFCRKEIKGRADKKYCDLNCKNQHGYRLRQATKSEVAEIDRMLHRNRIILATLMGDSRKETFDRIVLTRAKFRYEFHTGHYLNKEGKMYWLVYDYAWMTFADQKILVVKKAYSK